MTLGLEFLRISLRIYLFWHLFFVRLLGTIIKKQANPLNGHEILLTGTFYSSNWVHSHIIPIALSKGCSKLIVVTVFPLQPLEGIEIIHPPRILLKVLGVVPARLLTFFWLAISRRPGYVGGFHLLFNGLVANIASKLIGAKSIYFCVGGPAEVIGGGVFSGNRVFEKLRQPDIFIEKQLLNAVKQFDLIITMGSKAVLFFKEHKIHGDFHVVPGGINSRQFTTATTAPDFDIITVGRLEQVKRFDIFIKSIDEIKKSLPMVKAVIIGDGALALELLTLIKELGLENNILLPGVQSNVEAWLRKSKIFMLTSDSEGLSLAMMEAMLCGLPAIVSNVGDLGDLVAEGKNGFLISTRAPENFAVAVLNLLANPERMHEFSMHARNSALQYTKEATTIRWDAIL